MTKTQFLEKLREELNGNVSQSVVHDNIDYYERYITDEVRSGKSEEEVLSILGDPWVIAQTIINAEGSTSTDNIHESETGGYSGGNTHFVRKKEQEVWWKKLLLILFVLMIIIGIFAIMTGLLKLLAPLLIPVLVFVLVRRVLTGGRS
ncbi:MAG: DUF1700 domain-containing protein [Schaedlerella sp.]|nr:DUF1700 domain-containing protein [Schaedlerella sp.]